jgi:putative PIN family toxin of toxin-antitoxin system
LRWSKSVPKAPRVVLDTNILVSATITGHGLPARIFTAALSKRLVLILSHYLLAEYLEVLQRPHIVKKYPKLSERSPVISRFLRTRTQIVEPVSIERIVPDDPKDDAILACAKEGRANYIVSGDEHLIAMNQYLGIKILTPREFVEQVLREKTDLQ